MSDRAPTLTPAEVDAIRERCEAATLGPWYTVDSMWLPRDGATYVIAGHHDPHVGVPVLDSIEIDEWDADQPGPDYTQPTLDLEFAAHARADIPRLLASHDALAARLGEQAPLVEAAVAYYRATEAEARAIDAMNADLDTLTHRDTVMATKARRNTSWHTLVREMAAYHSLLQQRAAEGAAITVSGPKVKQGEGQGR